MGPFSFTACSFFRLCVDLPSGLTSIDALIALLSPPKLTLKKHIDGQESVKNPVGTWSEMESNTISRSSDGITLYRSFPLKQNVVYSGLVSAHGLCYWIVNQGK